MYRELPKEIQKKVRKYLERDEFSKAKELHDTWIAECKQVSNSVSKKTVVSQKDLQ